jgi:cellulose synthase (UDP-forming)
VLFRRAALADVGGFDEVSVTEDFVTSIRIHARGWRSVYYPYLLASGLGPETLASYFGQQFRWARGSVGALITGEPLRRGLNRAQRLQYLLATTFYLTGLVTLVYVALPILYMFFGLSAFSETAGSFVFFYGPYLLLGLATLRWGLGRRLRLEHLQFTFGSFPVYALASLLSLVGAKASFNVTAKEVDGRVRPPALAGVTVGVLALTVVALVVGPFLQGGGARTFTNLSWGTVNVLLLWPVAATAVREARGLTSGPSTREESR